MDVNGDERLHPLRAGFPVCDTVGGLNAAFAIMAALYHRERTGEGQMIDVALLDSIMPLMGWVAANLLIGGQHPVADGQRQLHRRALRAPSRRRTATSTSPPTSRSSGRRSPRSSGVAELKTDPRFQERDARKKNRKALTPLLEAKLAAEPHRASGSRRSTPATSPRATSCRLEAALDQPQVRHREDARDRRRSTGIGEVPLFGLTAQLEKTPGRDHVPPAAPRRAHRGDPGRARLR